MAMSQCASNLTAFAFAVAAVAVPSTGFTQVDTRAAVEHLRSHDAAERRRALESLKGLGRDGIDRDLRRALFEALQREGDAAAQRARADKRGEPVSFPDDPELGVNVAQFVVELRDPESIPALVSAVGLGATSVLHALAAFGEPAAVAVARLVQQPDARVSAVDQGLLTLRFIVEDGGWRTLSRPALQAIRQVARQRLTGTQSVTTLWWAIDLAVALDDRRLRTIVEAFAADHNEAIARGVLDLELAQRTQKWAADSLAGVPPLPPRKKPPV